METERPKEPCRYERKKDQVRVVMHVDINTHIAHTHTTLFAWRDATMFVDSPRHMAVSASRDTLLRRGRVCAELSTCSILLTFLRSINGGFNTKNLKKKSSLLENDAARRSSSVLGTDRDLRQAF